MSYDFSKLTDAQKHILTFQGWEAGERRQPRKATVRNLIERGLLVARERKFSGGLIVTEYDVPLAVHIAWCALCATNPP